jgi:alginate O-acetyltransferase complex protein AlgI
MLFNSLHFLIFFPIVVLIYFSLPHKYRWGLLLLASYYFYMSWKIEYALLLAISTLVDYCAGLWMAKTKEIIRRTKFLILSLLVNLGLLFTFKYFNFFSDSVRSAFQKFALPIDTPHLKVLLPVGISFYTFQTLSYTIDLYRGSIPVERHLGRFAVYVSFFPQLVAGPVERAKNLLPQILEKHAFDPYKVSDGLRIMLWGYFLKMVIADRLGIIVDQVYSDVTGFSGFYLLIATYFFAYQLFCDFAGYSFIAIGAAKVMGFNLMENFRRPYFAKSVGEIWQRWHISLSTWFRDYLYIPLGGNRRTKHRWYFNIFVVFLISGLWHGAGWTFIIWGVLQGFYLIMSILTKGIRSKISRAVGLEKIPSLHSLVKIFITFHLFLIGLFFFRANSISDAIYIFTHLFTDWHFSFADINSRLFDNKASEFILTISAVIFMETVHVIQERRSISQLINRRPLVFRWAVYLGMLFIIILFGVFEKTPFIYFQF